MFFDTSNRRSLLRFIFVVLSAVINTAGCPHQLMVINEVNGYSDNESMTFAELFYIKVSECPDDGCPLEDFYLLMIQGETESSRGAVVRNFRHLSDTNTITNNKPYITVGIAMHSYWTGMSGDVSPIAIVLLKTNDSELVDRYLRPTVQNGSKHINEKIARLVSPLVCDMVVFGRYTKKIICPVFNIINTHLSASPYIVYRELDFYGYKDLSINRCYKDGNSEAFGSNLQLGYPSPGLPNKCTGVVVNVEMFLQKAQTLMTETCTEGFINYPKPASLTLLRETLLDARRILDDPQSANITDFNLTHRDYLDLMLKGQTMGHSGSNSGIINGLLGGLGGLVGGFIGGFLAGIFGGFKGLFGGSGGGGLGSSGAGGSNPGSLDTNDGSTDGNGDPDGNGGEDGFPTTQQPETRKRKKGSKEEDDSDSASRNEDDEGFEPPNESKRCFMETPKNNPFPTPCGQTEPDSHIVPLNKLIGKHFIYSKYTVGVDNLADLVLARGDGQFNWQERDLDTTFVCKKHYREIATHVWAQNLPRFLQRGEKKLKCNVPHIAGFQAHEPRVVGQKFASKEMSKALLKIKAVFVPVGQGAKLASRLLHDANRDAMLR